MNSDGFLLSALGILVLVQVFKGDALYRLNLTPRPASTA